MTEVPVLHSIILGKGEPLLILHGLFGMGDNWKSLGMRFAEDYEVHLIDQRNHGRSFHSDDFSYELMTEDLLRYMQHHNIDRAYLLGHSMGGKTVMNTAVVHPEKVKKLIVADIAPKYYPVHHTFILDALHELDLQKMKTRGEIDAALREYIDDSGIRQFIMKNIYRKTRDTFAFRFNLDSITEHIEEVGRELPVYAQYDGPVLFLKGARSSYIKPEDEALIRAHFPNSEIKTIQHAGHWLHAENPGDFYNEVINFLKKP